MPGKPGLARTGPKKMVVTWTCSSKFFGSILQERDSLRPLLFDIISRGMASILTSNAQIFHTKAFCFLQGNTLDAGGSSQPSEAGTKKTEGDKKMDVFFVAFCFFLSHCHCCLSPFFLFFAFCCFFCRHLRHCAIISRHTASSYTGIDAIMLAPYGPRATYVNACITLSLAFNRGIEAIILTPYGADATMCRRFYLNEALSQ